MLAKILEISSGNLFKKINLGIVIIILSIFSYYFIERPARSKNNKFKIILSLILTSILLLFIVNLNIIHQNGYKGRVPEILQKSQNGPTWSQLKNDEYENCFQNVKACSFNNTSDRKVFIIGDSHMASLMFNLKDRVVKKNYKFVTSTFAGCIFFPGFNLIETRTQKKNSNCNDNYFEKLKQTFSSEKNSILIFGGRFPLYLSNFLFDNKEGGIEGREWVYKYISVNKYDTIQISFKNEISKIKKNNKIILIYPIPEIGFDLYKKFFLLKVKKLNNKSTLKLITTSYEVYKNRTKSSFKLLDSIRGENIYRVYPHKLFCNTIIKNRCVTHDDKNMFYADDDHPSLKGAEMINDLIMKEIEKIELKSE